MEGIKKEYHLLPGSTKITVLGSAVLAFAGIPEVTTIVITVPAFEGNAETAKAKAALPPELLASARPEIHFVPGGKNRRASVSNALAFLAEENLPPSLVLIHDGARPWVSPALIRRIIDETKKHHAAIPLVPLAETPKETESPLANLHDNETAIIRQHLRRANVGAAQTPQGFVFPAIYEAHKQAALKEATDGVEFTDDAEIWAAFCGSVAAICGEKENRKITFPEDLA